MKYVMPIVNKNPCDIRVDGAHLQSIPVAQLCHNLGALQVHVYPERPRRQQPVRRNPNGRTPLSTATKTHCIALFPTAHITTCDSLYSFGMY